VAAYLQPGDYAAYGVPDATAAQANSASALIDAYLGRPEGLIWSPDANGAPAYMANATPSLSLTGQAVSPGSSVTLTVPFAQFGNQNIGDVVILDRGNTNLTEACVVTAAGGNALTLAAVQFAHAAPTVDFGLTILDEAPIRPGATLVRTSKSPIARIHCAFARHGLGKLPRQISDAGYGLEPFSAALSPGWTRLDLTCMDVNQGTGAILLPPFFLEAGNLEIRLRYVAGWSQVPGAIAQACANLVRSAIDTPFSGDVKLLKSGDGTVERFSPGALDADARAMLQPYKTVRL
jgi:hypothetical protein